MVVAARSETVKVVVPQGEGIGDYASRPTLATLWPFGLLLVVATHIIARAAYARRYSATASTKGEDPGCLMIWFVLSVMFPPLGIAVFIASCCCQGCGYASVALVGRQASPDREYMVLGICIGLILNVTFLQAVGLIPSRAAEYQLLETAQAPPI